MFLVVTTRGTWDNEDGGKTWRIEEWMDLTDSRFGFYGPITNNTTLNSNPNPQLT